MEDYLMQLCKNYNIQLSYVDDDTLILTCSIRNGLPAILANNLFKHCSEAMANAVMCYCTAAEGRESYYDAIEDYAKENLYSLEYIIEPPPETFLSLLKSGTKPSHADQAEEAEGSIPSHKTKKKQPKAGRTPKGIKPAGQPPTEKDLPSSLVEVGIASITCKDFSGNISSIKPDETITSSSEDVMELDILLGGQEQKP